MTHQPPPPELASLVAAIRETPDDDDLRLVCGDWYEEHGDAARAEFIRTQIERSRLANTDARQPSLMARELRLLRKHAARWTSDVHPHFKKVRFRRGFAEYAHLHLTHWLHHRRQLLAWEPVRDLSLTGWHRASDDLVRRVAACEELRYVERLRLHPQGPEREPGRNVIDFIDSPHLKRLRAIEFPVILTLTPDERRRFERASALSRVEELHLPFIGGSAGVAGDWLADGTEGVDWGGLRSLSLPPSSDDFSTLRGLPWWSRLERLSLAFSPTGAGWADELMRTPLRSLCVETYTDPPLSLARLVGPDSRCRFRSLELRGSTDLESLAGAPGASSVEELRVRTYRFEVKSFPPRLLVPSLRVLDARDTTAGDALLSVESPPPLRHVAIGAKNAATTSHEALFRSGRLASLVSAELYLGGTNDGGLVEFLDSSPHLSRLVLRIHALTQRTHDRLASWAADNWLDLVIDGNEDWAERRERLSAKRRPPIDGDCDANPE